MAKILLIEVEGLKQLNLEKDLLKHRYDFTKIDAFRAIDQYKMNSILRDDFREFLIKNGHNATSLESDSIMRRLDSDQDGRITYSEFCEHFEKINVSNLVNK